MPKNRYLLNMSKKNIKENKVFINEQGEIEYQLTDETKILGHLSIEKGKRLGHQIICNYKKNGI